VRFPPKRNSADHLSISRRVNWGHYITTSPYYAVYFFKKRLTAVEAETFPSPVYRSWFASILDKL
jgi:hypothetical protein